MEWDDFRYILVLSRTKTLSGAAQELGVVRTTVGRRIKAIEAALGVCLFNRAPSGFIPTAAGQELADVAAQIESKAHAAEGRVLGRDATLAGKLRVSVVDFVYEGRIEAFVSFMARYPGIELTVLTTYDEVSLRRREADVVLRVNNTPSEHLVGRRLGPVEFRPYASRELVERIGLGAGLDQFPWLRIDERLGDRVVEQWLATHAPTAPTTLRFGSYQALRTSIAAGVGVHFLPCIAGDADPNLIQIGPVWPELSRTLWVLTIPELATNSRVRAFMDHLYESLDAPTSD